MLIFERLKTIVSELRKTNARWAICGGVAACLYRETPRYTGDIDIVLGDIPGQNTRQCAESLLQRLGYSPKIGFVAGTDRALLRTPALVMAREDQSGRFVGIDLLLPVQPWIESAVIRAQTNQIDFGFDVLPAITPEDLIIAKLFALQSSPDRPYDRDDIISILGHQKDLDRGYIQESVNRFQLSVVAREFKF